MWFDGFDRFRDVGCSKSAGKEHGYTYIFSNASRDRPVVSSACASEFSPAAGRLARIQQKCVDAVLGSLAYVERFRSCDMDDLHDEGVREQFPEFQSRRLVEPGA